MNKTLYREPNRHGYLRWKRDDAYQLAVVRAVVERVGLVPGDHLIEVGAGLGRYTDLLRRLGLSVTATEPDDALYTELRHRFEADAQVTVVQRDAASLPVDEGVAAICGFHVLHHLRGIDLTALAAAIRWASSANSAFRGWFFIEPNPLNPLYAVQITAHPAMRWSEEHRIWTTDYQRFFAAGGLDFRILGEIGLLPPQFTSRLPFRLLRPLQPRLRRSWRSPFALYRVFGAVPPLD